VIRAIVYTIFALAALLIVYANSGQCTAGIEG
jgi:hypothetical protein